MVSFRPHVPHTFKSWKVKTENDDETTYNRWTNKDIVPVPLEQRLFTWHAFSGYWVAAGVTTNSWALGSSNLASGLTIAESIGGVLVGSFLSGIVAFLCGEAGVKYHLGFPMMSRSTFGMYGSYFVIMLKLFVNFIFCGVQIFWGGLAVKVILAAIFPSFQNLKNTLPASAVIETDELIGFVIFICIFTPLMFRHPSRLQPVLVGAFFLVGTTILGLFIWAVASNHGASPLAPTNKISGSTRSFLILKSMSAVAGSFTGGSIRQSDWTRFAKTKRAPVISQLIGAPLTITITATFGAFATSAVNSMYGQTIWNPIDLLAFLMDEHYTAKTRAGCFFAGCGFLCSQISVNLAQNSISCGMDLAALFPKYIDVTRGSLIMCFVAYLIQPWRFVKQASTFITVLNSFGMFVAPLAGINAVDFWIVRKRRWNVPDLYHGDSSSIYWYTSGLNWRAFLAWTLVIWASFPGFLNSVANINVSIGWIRTFQVTWVIGFLGSALIYYIFCLLSPPPGKPYVDEPDMFPEVLDGEEYNADKSSDLDVEKTSVTGSAKPVDSNV